MILAAVDLVASGGEFILTGANQGDQGTETLRTILDHFCCKCKRSQSVPLEVVPREAFPRGRGGPELFHSLV